MQIAIDIGGTFVDAIALDEGTGQVRFEKVLATRERPWIGVLAAFDALSIELSQVDRFVHGTTMGLNAVLERRGATTGILTNEGFRDIFLIGRGNVPNSEMFHFRWRQPAPIVRRRHTIGAAGRMDASGAVVAELDEAGVRAAADELADAGVESVAICFLHSYRNPAHEQRAAAIIAEHRPELSVSISSDIQREYREFERTSTTVLDAYIRPVIEGYLGRLGDGLENQDFRGRFLVMRSGGGAMTAAQAACSPTQTLLSGPAGGIAGAAQLARALERSSLLTFDMGGTSVDVCVIEDSLPAVSHDAEIERHPLLMPVFDIRTIGAGGGSIAAIEDGLLCVGPHSAGADPGPACYGRGGTSPTVTDAAVCLGYIDAGTFLRGAMPLDVRAAHDALRDGVGVALGLDARDAASRVFEVLLARTVGPVRQLTMERGADPREFSLLAYGGAGPMLGPLVARELGIREVIVPNFPSGFSAWGMLAVDLVDDVAQTDLRLLDELDADDLRRTLAELEQQVCDSLVHQGAERGGLAVQRQLDLRYAGQEHALTMTVDGLLDPGRLRERFDGEHERRYGHAMPNRVELLGTRVRAIGAQPEPRLPQLAPREHGDVQDALAGTRDAWCFAAQETRRFSVFERARLAAGDRLVGPAIVEEGTTATILLSDQQLEVDRYGHLLVTPVGEET